MFYHLYHLLQSKLENVCLNYYLCIIRDIVVAYKIPENEIVNFGINIMCLFNKDIFNKNEYVFLDLSIYMDGIRKISFNHFIHTLNCYEKHYDLELTDLNNNRKCNFVIDEFKIINKGTDGTVYRNSDTTCVKINNIFKSNLPLLRHCDINEFIITRLVGKINSVNIMKNVKCKINKDKDIVFLEMPYIEYTSIYNKIHNKDILIQILHVMACLHINNFVHNDLSARNILCIKLSETKKIELKLQNKSIIIETDYLVKIIDFNRSSNDVLGFSDYSDNNFEIDVLYFSWTCLKYIKLNHPIISYIFDDVDMFSDCENFIDKYSSCYFKDFKFNKVIFEILNDDEVLSYYNVIKKKNNVVESIFLD